MRATVSIFAALVLASSFANAKPTRAMLRRALEQHQRSLVEVQSSQGTGPGILVGAEGQALTSVLHVDLREARVKGKGAVWEGKVKHASAALKFALVELPLDSYPAAAVHAASQKFDGVWVIGVLRNKKGVETPVAARARRGEGAFFDVPLALEPGSPLFDTQGRVIALSVEKIGGAGCRALSMARVKAELAADTRK